VNGINHGEIELVVFKFLAVQKFSPSQQGRFWALFIQQPLLGVLEVMWVQ